MDGYAKLATLMGAYPEVAIVRRFAALNAQNVLYLQAELVDLESRLRRYEKEDRNSGDQARVDYAVDWVKLRNARDLQSDDTGGTPSDRDVDEEVEVNETVDEDDELHRGRRWRLILQIRGKLKEYNEAVLQQSAFAQLSKPNPRDLRFLKEWVQRPDMGGVLLVGQDSDVWENPDRLDLVVIKPRKRDSLLSAWLSDRCIHWYHQNIGYRLTKLFARRPSVIQQRPTIPDPVAETEAPPVADPEAIRLDSIARRSRTTYHSQKILLRIARVLALTLASLLLVAAIVVLYFVQEMPARLGIIGAFTALFSLVLGSVTDGAIVDVFAASAAFAAVQVVFVGSSVTTVRGIVNMFE